MIPRPYRPDDDEQPTMPYPYEASHPGARLFGQGARPTQRPAVTAGPVHIDEQPTMRMPPQEFLAHIKAQREGWATYHRQQSQALRREATQISEDVAEMVAICNRMDYRHQELRSWANLNKREAEELFTLAHKLPLIRRDIAHWRVERNARIERANRHEDAIVQIQAEMAVVGR